MIRLRELRDKAGWTQKDVAQMIGVRNTSISMYELGQRQLTPDLIAKFCALYHVSADYLLGLSSGEDTTDDMAGDYQPNRRHQPRDKHGLAQAEADNKIGLSDYEAKLLAAYNAAPANIQAGIAAILLPFAAE